jgi:hypothetical protein
LGLSHANAPRRSLYVVPMALVASAAFFSSRLERDARAGIAHCSLHWRWEAERLCPSAPPQTTKGGGGVCAIFLRAAALAFPIAAAPLISPGLCGPPTGLTIQQQQQGMTTVFYHVYVRACGSNIEPPRLRSCSFKARVGVWS